MVFNLQHVEWMPLFPAVLLQALVFDLIQQGKSVEINFGKALEQASLLKTFVGCGILAQLKKLKIRVPDIGRTSAWANEVIPLQPPSKVFYAENFSSQDIIERNYTGFINNLKLRCPPLAADVFAVLLKELAINTVVVFAVPIQFMTCAANNCGNVGAAQALFAMWSCEHWL